ncbi:hypothetical protein JXJ21_13785, partial [candidate division KSB1 bacterium]|nr:hypothetical protein [candidate division KSB1 bacterium]
IWLRDSKGSFQLFKQEIGDLPPGDYELSFRSTGLNDIRLDGFAIVPGAALADELFQIPSHKPAPRFRCQRNQLLCRYDPIDTAYGIRWQEAKFKVREIRQDPVEALFRRSLNFNSDPVIHGNDKARHLDLYIQPEPLPPGRRVFRLVVCGGAKTELPRLLETYDPEDEALENYAENAGRSLCHPRASHRTGRKYEFSQARMAAQTLTNVIYPIYCQCENVRHYTPGRCYDSLYTWDAGFIGLGLMELDMHRAVENLNSYLTDEQNSHAAFIHHGTPLPVQFYLFLEIWNRTQDMHLLKRFYPALRHWYRFLMGRMPGSTMRNLGSGLIRTFDYFYNSGGWDDYPVQVYSRKMGYYPRIAPAVGTSHAIRAAKILRLAADHLALQADIQQLTKDIDELAAALQDFAWDRESGYFSYVLHDERLAPVEFLRHPDGSNFNCGLDGVSPLIAGICRQEQIDALIAHLKNPCEMKTPIGLTTVAQNAPYYDADGYWNGSVWMPHQWFLWKAMFEIGEMELAHWIARTALDLWAREVEETYYCWEKFDVASGRGSMWHQFGGLSCPVLNWFAAYHTLGTISVGLDCWILKREFNADRSQLQLTLRRPFASGGSHLIIVMNPDHTYDAFLGEKSLNVAELHPGTIQITLPAGSTEYALQIEAAPASTSRAQ